MSRPVLNQAPWMCEMTGECGALVRAPPAPREAGRVLRQRTRTSGSLEDDHVQAVGDVFAAIGRIFERRVDLLPADQVEEVVGVLEKLGDASPGNLISLVLEPIDLDRVTSDLRNGLLA